MATVAADAVRQNSQIAQTGRLACAADRLGVWRGVALLAVLAALLRVPGVDRPLVGHFATKNATYAMIARNWAMGRAPFWLPTTDCMAGGGRGLHLLELPLAAYLAGAGWAVCGGSLDVWGRAISIAFSAAGAGLMFILVRRWHSPSAAWAAALVLAFSPVSIVFGQSFMLESSVVFFMLATLYCVESWLAGGRWRWFALSSLSLAFLLCTKIYMVVMLLPLAAMAARKIAALPDTARRRRWLVGCFAIGAMGAAPAVSWCLMALVTASPDNPQSAHVFDSIYRSASVHQAPYRLLSAGGFYLRLLGNLAGAGLTPVGFGLACLGAFDRSARRHAVWLAAMAALVLLLPGKFFELRYYTLLLVPPLAVLAGIGWERLASRAPAPRLLAAACLLAGVCCSLRLAVGPAFVTPAEDRSVTAAAAAMRGLAADGAPVATMHGAASDLLYYCDRPGWALSVNDRRLAQTLDRCRRWGARWLVVADLSSIAHRPSATALLASLPLARQGDDYRIYRLPPPRD